MYTKNELFIFSFINSNYDISIQNIVYKIFNLSKKNKFNFFRISENNKINFLKEIFAEEKIKNIFEIFSEKNIFFINEERKKIIEICKNKKINLIYYSHKDYPTQLQMIKEPPFILFIKGNLPKENKFNKIYAIVGTRNPSEAGINFTKEIAKYLYENNFYNISGLAKGIDEIGHIKTLGKTGVILGQGLLTDIYPRKNKELAEIILENNGFILSELLPYTKISKFYLLKRNRIQSALASGIIISETSIKGGTVQTFKYAREQKKKIYISNFNAEFISKYQKDLILIKDSSDFEEKIKDNLEQKKLFY